MVKQYNSAREVLQALLDGKKIRLNTWDNVCYRQLYNGNFIDQEGHNVNNSSLPNLNSSYWEEYVPLEERWDWKVGDCVNYRIDLELPYFQQFEILYINDEVCFCKRVEGSDYIHLYNKPESNRRMKKL